MKLKNMYKRIFSFLKNLFIKEKDSNSEYQDLSYDQFVYFGHTEVNKEFFTKTSSSKKEKLPHRKNRKMKKYTIKVHKRMNGNAHIEVQNNEKSNRRFVCSVEESFREISGKSIEELADLIKPILENWIERNKSLDSETYIIECGHTLMILADLINFKEENYEKVC